MDLTLWTRNLVTFWPCDYNIDVARMFGDFETNN